MKKIILLLVLVSFSGCQYFDKSVPTKDELLKRELESINWSEVDEFPSVADCDSIEDISIRRQCFFDFLAQSIQQKLDIDTLSVLYPELDTMAVRVTVFPDSSIQFEPQFPKDSVRYDVKKIDSILHSRLLDFPKINPAIKRGIPVKTQFVLPVILSIE
ncbi:MAG: hypothetical protein IR153_02110 [Flavobacterium sp.]|nr:hypothetical protein [Flavobacterium sp.]